MSLSDRLRRLAKANLNALLEVVAENAPHSDLDRLSDDDLEAELERRRLRRERELGERAVRERAEKAARDRFGGAAPRPWTRSARTLSYDPKLARYYAQLEVPYGADLETVKQAYRRLMRAYHPDRHAANPEKLKAATEVAQSLGEAYRELEKVLV